MLAAPTPWIFPVLLEWFSLGVIIFLFRNSISQCCTPRLIILQQLSMFSEVK
jgi:hypothetical protein